MDSTENNSFCIIYDWELNKMQKALKNTTKTEEKIDILKKFSDNFLMTPKYWKLLLNLEQQKLLVHKDEDEILQKALSHFYFPEHYQLLNHIAELVILEKNIECNEFTFNDRTFYIGNEPKSYKEAIKELKKNMFFPRENLHQIYEAYIKYGAKPVSTKEKQQYNKCLKLYNKFLKAGKDDKKWLECIKELEDEEVVIANIELRLGKDQHYRNQEIWKYYIEYLRVRNSMAMLDIYRRYCRLFISDNEKREEYRKEIEKVEKIGKNASDFWIDTVKWENDFGIAGAEIQQRAMASMLQDVSDKKKDKIKKVQQKIDKPKDAAKIYFKNCTKSLPQTTAFPPTMIKFMLKNAIPEMLHKFHQTCKYFFILYPSPVCHRLVFHPYTIRTIQYIEQSLFLPQNAGNFTGLNNIFLSHTLIIVASSKETSLLSMLISKLQKCEIKSAEISNQIISLKEFEFLICSGNVKNLRLTNTKIMDENNTPLEISEIEKMLKNYKNVIHDFNYF